MGMSASQARLLSLQARMSDVEYEGQQINQQRLVLSNKMNEVMEKMTNMDVPTPPSKQDFLYNKYSGKTKNGKKISAELNDNGTFNVTKDVSGRIVEDAGLQNITSGSQMKGSEVNIPLMEGDGFHICKGDEEAMYHISDEQTTGKVPFTKYEATNYRKIWTENEPKKVDKFTKGTSVEGIDNKCYSNNNPQDTYIKVPNLKYVEDTKAGFYSNQKYYGTDINAINEKVYYYGGTEYTSAEALRNAYMDEREVDGKKEKYCKLSESEISQALRYKSQEYDKKSGSKLGSPSYFTQPIQTENCVTNGHYEPSGTYTEIKLEWPLENSDYQDILKDCADKFQKLISGASDDMEVNGTSVAIEGRSDATTMAVCSPEISKQTGVTPVSTATFDPNNTTNAKYTYNEFIGVDEDQISGDFDSSSEYARINDKGIGESLVKKGSDMLEHNREVDENMYKDFYYEADGKFVRCSGSTAKSLAEGGKILYAEVQSGGRGITNKEPDYSVIKDNMYVIDGENNALLISAHGGIEWAKGQIEKAGKKLFQKGTGDMICYDEDQKGKTTVNGCQTMPVTEADGMDMFHNNTAFQDALCGLQNSFPGKSSDKYCGSPYSWEDFSVIIDNSGQTQSYRFCVTKDLTSVDGQVRVYTPGAGTYQEKISNVEPTYDDNGYLEKLILPNGEVVDMEVEQAVDEIEYDKAMNKYNIAKIEYDKEVNELNKQTSIYQRQDKTLELKLTRLDTERNALNTEIDAVKKVIQDATEKGFKTFSG